MSQVEDTFENLTSEQHEQLMYAFESGVEMLLFLDGDYIFGVNIVDANIEIIESQGAWSYGKLKTKEVG